MAGTNPNFAAPVCYFFDKLPVELRLIIYKYTFEGSRVQATLADNSESSAAQCTAGIVLHHSTHFRLLISCRTIYNEALATYWSETVLSLKCPPTGFIDFGSFQTPKFKDDTYTHRLCTSLPEVAKAHVRHVRGMVLPFLRSIWINRNPSLTASKLLGTFKKLSTCEITPTLAHPVDGIFTHTEDPRGTGYSQFKMVSGQEPARFLDDCFGVNNTDEVSFFFKGFIKYFEFEDPLSVVGLAFKRRSLTQFRNLSNGVAFEDVTGKMDDEEGYQKVLQANV